MTTNHHTDVRLGIVMPSALARELAKRARASDRSISSVVRVLLAAALRDAPPPEVGDSRAARRSGGGDV